MQRLEYVQDTARYEQRGYDDFHAAFVDSEIPSSATEDAKFHLPDLESECISDEDDEDGTPVIMPPKPSAAPVGKGMIISPTGDDAWGQEDTTALSPDDTEIAGRRLSHGGSSHAYYMQKSSSGCDRYKFHSLEGNPGLDFYFDECTNTVDTQMGTSTSGSIYSYNASGAIVFKSNGYPKKKADFDPPETYKPKLKIEHSV